MTGFSTSQPVQDSKHMSLCVDSSRNQHTIRLRPGDQRRNSIGSVRMSSIGSIEIGLFVIFMV